MRAGTQYIPRAVRRRRLRGWAHPVARGAGALRHRTALGAGQVGCAGHPSTHDRHSLVFTCRLGGLLLRGLLRALQPRRDGRLDLERRERRQRLFAVPVRRAGRREDPDLSSGRNREVRASCEESDGRRPLAATLLDMGRRLPSSGDCICESMRWLQQRGRRRAWTRMYVVRGLRNSSVLSVKSSIASPTLVMSVRGVNN